MRSRASTLSAGVASLTLLLSPLGSFAQGTHATGDFGFLGPGSGQTVTVTVNGMQFNFQYAYGESPATFADQVAEELNAFAEMDDVSASPGYGSVNLVSTTTGESSDYPFSVSGAPVEVSGPTLTGGS